MESNPYASPSASLYQASSSTGADTASQEVISQLERTKPWAQFMSVMAFIGAAFMIGMGGLMMIGGALGASTGAPGFGSAEGAMLQGMALFYALMGASYIYPGVKLWKFGSRIGQLSRTRSIVELESALNEQRVLWKSVGIITIVSILLAIGLVFLSIATVVSKVSA
jgi:hypothetical protein